MCMFVYVCVHVVRERGTISASMCGEVYDLVMPLHCWQYVV